MNLKILVSNLIFAFFNREQAFSSISSDSRAGQRHFAAFELAQGLWRARTILLKECHSEKTTVSSRYREKIIIA